MIEDGQRLTVRYATAKIQYCDMTGDVANERHIVIDDEDGRAGLRDSFQQIAQFCLFSRIEAGCGFVQQQH